MVQKPVKSLTEYAKARVVPGAAASAIEEPVVVDATAVAHLKDISRILSAKTKSQMCLEATCGEKGLVTRLEDRAVPHARTFAPQLRLRQELGSRACNPRRRGWTTMARST